MSDAERIERARQAKLALSTFLDPAFEQLVEVYHNRIADICASTPWEANKISALANAIRIAQEVRSQIATIIADGDVANAGRARADRVEKLTPTRRRLLNIGAF